MRNILFVNLLLFAFFTSYGQRGCEIIDYSTTIEVNKNKLIEERTYIIQINNKESNWITDIRIPYKDQDKLNIQEASIVDIFGNTIRKLKKKEIITRNDRSRGAFYEDSWVKEFKLKWNQYPYRIKYKYRKTCDKYISIKHWYPLVYTNVHTNKATLKVILPKDYKVTLSKSKELKHDVNEIEEKKIHYWEAENISPIKNEWFSPPQENLMPFVKITPNKFDYDIQGSFESWITYGEWIEQLNTDLDILTAYEKIKVNKLIEGLDDSREVIKVLYHYMQDNTRYINVSIDIGGLKPYPASYVCENKYGDCKALTIYMKALLKHAGIDSYYSIIYAGDNPRKVQREIPSHQFNHVILSVPLERDTIWLENTNKYAPFNYLGTFTQNRYALQVNSGQTKLIKTKALRENEVLVKNRFYFDLDSEGNGKLNLLKDMKGEAFEKYQYFKNEYSEKEQRLEIEKNLSLKNYEIDSWSFDQKNRDSLNLKLQVNIYVKNQFRKIGNMILLKPISNPFTNLANPNIRENPIRINFPINQANNIIYNLPFTDQYEVELPKNLNIISKYGIYKVSYTHLNNQLIVSQNFQLNAGDYSLKEYPDIYRFSENIKESLKKSVIILNQF